MTEREISPTQEIERQIIRSALDELGFVVQPVDEIENTINQLISIHTNPNLYKREKKDQIDKMGFQTPNTDQENQVLLIIWNIYATNKSGNYLSKQYINPIDIYIASFDGGPHRIFGNDAIRYKSVKIATIDPNSNVINFELEKIQDQYIYYISPVILPIISSPSEG